VRVVATAYVADPAVLISRHDLIVDRRAFPAYPRVGGSLSGRGRRQLLAGASGVTY
jgi:hypothetical protein